MRIGGIDTDKKTLIVAEIGNNHEGSFALAEELIGLAANAGADAVKFQTFKTERFVNPHDHARFARMKRFELSPPQFESLAKTARQAGLIFISTPLDLESAEFLDGIVAAFKIASGDNDFFPLLEYVAGTGKPVIISGGLAEIADLKRAKSILERVWREKSLAPGLAFLHCVSSYPVPQSEANLGAIRYLHGELGCTIGYSDHTIGIDAAVIAAALGARIIEKHFTVRKDYSEFRDHQLSADPLELSALVRKVRETTAMLGSGLKAVQPTERDGVRLYRRSIVAKRDMAAGERVDRKDLMWIRPAGGLRPGDEALVVGKRLLKPVKTGDLLLPENLE